MPEKLCNQHLVVVAASVSRFLRQADRLYGKRLKLKGGEKHFQKIQRVKLFTKRNTNIGRYMCLFSGLRLLSLSALSGVRPVRSKCSKSLRLVRAKCSKLLRLVRSK